MESGGEKKQCQLVCGSQRTPRELSGGAPNGWKRRQRRVPHGQGRLREVASTAAESIRKAPDGRKSSRRFRRAPKEAQRGPSQSQSRHNPMCFTRFCACQGFRAYVSRREVERHRKLAEVAVRMVKITPRGPQEALKTGPMGSCGFPEGSLRRPGGAQKSCHATRCSFKRDVGIRHLRRLLLSRQP